MALDLGSKRIGVAVSDRSGTIASPLTVLERTGSVAGDHRRIAVLAREEEVELIVVGMPLSMDGSMGTAARAAAAETAALASVVDVPVETIDERLTTVSAHNILADRMRAKQRRRVVDKVAAAVMLQSWLDGRSSRHGEPGSPS